MTMTTNKTAQEQAPLTFDVEVTNVRAVTFARGDSRYVFALDANQLTFWERYGHDAKRVSRLFDEGFTDSHWFAFFVADCMDPPVTVVRAASFQEAYETFIDETPSLRIDPKDFADYGIGPDGNMEEAACSFDSNGNPVDTDAVQVFEPDLVRIDCGNTEA